MDAPDLELTILMPCLDEAETVGVCVTKALRFLEQSGVRGEVLVADNGSSDGSQALARAAGARVVDVPAKGYGSALLGGIAAAQGRFVIMGDADDSYDFEDLMPFVVQLRQGKDLVMGNRFRGGIARGAMPPLHYYLGNPVLTAIGRLFFRIPDIADFHCGLRGFNRASILRLGLVTTGMEFASEMVVKSALAGLDMVEVPTTLKPDGRSRPPHLRSWRDGWRHLRFMLIFSPRWLFLYPGLAAIAVGLAASLWLGSGPRTLGSVTLDIHTLLYAGVAVALGVQAVFFSVFTKVFGIGIGVLPRDPRLDRMFRHVTLETGLVAGGMLILAGLAGSAWAVGIWGEQGFGALDASQTMRAVIPSAVALMLGFQTVLGSFFLSVLGLSRQGSHF